MVFNRISDLSLYKSGPWSDYSQVTLRDIMVTALLYQARVM